jgi:hypothetical protein
MHASAQAVRPLIRNTSRVTPLGLLKTKKKVSAAPPPHLTGQRASPAKTMCRQKLRDEVPAARNLVLSCLPNRAYKVNVSVRFLHDFPRVHCRSISGSLLHWRISGGSETFPEQSQAAVVVDSHRSMATQRLVAAPLLPNASPHRHNIYPLAARDHGRGSSQNPRAKR